MAVHITNLSRTITFHLRNITRIRRFINNDTCHPAVCSLVLSRLDYCNGLLSFVPKSHILGLQRLQNWAARIIFIVDRRHDSSPLFKTLHWLPVKQRTIYKLLLYVYKALNGLAPMYISNCLKPYVPKRVLRSSSSYLRLDYPIPETKPEIGISRFVLSNCGIIFQRH